MNLFRWLLGGLLLAVAGAIGWQLLREQGGLVVVSWGEATYTLRAEVAVLLWLLAWAVLWALAWLLSLPFRAVRAYSRRQAARRFEHGLAALREDRLERAVQLLQAAAGSRRWRVPATLQAADALQRHGLSERAEALLATLPETDAGSVLMRADWSLRRGDPQAALGLIDRLPTPWPPKALRLRMEALAGSGRAHEALALLGPLRREGGVGPEPLAALEQRLLAGSLDEAADASTLLVRWEAMAKPAREQTPVILAFVRRAQAVALEDRAAEELATVLSQRWDSALVAAYGQLPEGRQGSRLPAVERWLQHHPDDPALLLAAGRIGMRESDLRAESWLQRAVAQGGGAAAWEALAHYYIGKDEARATTAFRNALRTPRGEPTLALPGVDLRARIAAEAVGEQRDAFGHPILPGH